MIKVAASTIFAVLESQPQLTAETIEVKDPCFSAVRRGLREIMRLLNDADDAEARAVVLDARTILSECLTVPVPFDGAVLHAINELFPGLDGDAVARRWGGDVAYAFDATRSAATALVQHENLLRIALAESLDDLFANDVNLRIYCHRQAVEHFRSLPLAQPAAIRHGVFLHSHAEYRDSPTFDVLLKCGPMRSKGWGAAPDGLVTAPRYRRLIKFVWEGCADEPGFGYEPTDTAGGNAIERRRGRYHEVSLVIQAERSADLGSGNGEVLDDLEWMRQRSNDTESRAAVLINLDQGQAALYPTRALLLSFDPDPRSETPITKRLPLETLDAGMYLIVPAIDDVGLAEVHADSGAYSREWKRKLRESRESNLANLINRLRSEGLTLHDLEAAIERWCEPPSNVIHAPQQYRHFAALARALEMPKEASVDGRGRKRVAPWEKLAWDEIRRSRGEAIQAGVQERELVDEQLTVILATRLTELRMTSEAKKGFVIDLPDDADIRGRLAFHRIEGFETGFRAPETELRQSGERRYFDRWRD
jgi:hypothetical protein